MKIISPFDRFVVVAGPNGSGKSTITKKFFKRGLLPEVYLNPDEIAKELSPNDVWAGRIAAGRKAVELRELYLEKRQSFTMETTLSGISEIAAIKEAINIGYKVSMIYVSLDGEFENIGRVKNRARKGGHDVPIVDILRRRQRSFENLLKIIDFIPRVIIIDNTQFPKTIFRKNKHIITYVSNDLPEWFTSIFCNKITDYRLEASSRHVLGIIEEDNDCKKY